jgi:sugar O-acyltransferase (sialic acid O-acetyltransferase NeuD family)
MEKALFGAGGQAREIASLFPFDFTFVVDDEYANENNKPLSSINKNDYEIHVAIGDPNSRKIISEKLHGFKFFSLIHPTAIIGKNVEIGFGSYIGPYSIITTNVKIGKHSVVSRQNSIGHDTITGDYLSMMASSVISGNCKIGNNVYIGNNASIREKTTICDDVIIGMNAAVVNNINEKGIYVGVPAKRKK